MLLPPTATAKCRQLPEKVASWTLALNYPIPQSNSLFVQYFWEKNCWNTFASNIVLEKLNWLNVPRVC